MEITVAAYVIPRIECDIRIFGLKIFNIFNMFVLINMHTTIKFVKLRMKYKLLYKL